MSFYTNAFRRGNNILVRGYDDNGAPFLRKENFKPTLFVPSNKNQKTEFVTLDNKYVSPVENASIAEAKEFIEKYSNVEGFPVYGNTDYVVQYLSDRWNRDVKWDEELVRTFSIDIETTTENGFPNIETANEEILLITVKDSRSKKLYTFGWTEYSPTREDVVYKYCSTESQLLREFVYFWSKFYPDVVTGWNINFFDIPYLVNRIERVLGEEYVQRLSPWGCVFKRKVKVMGREELSITIPGVSILDYLDLYKKFTYSAQESYRLDYICSQELGENKLENDYDTFKEFYTNDPTKFVDYNVHDADLVSKLDDKMKLVELTLTMAYNAKINYEDVFSQVKMWDAIIYNHLKAKGVVVPLKKGSPKKESFEGGYVKDPIIGAHNWVASFDLASLYPHLIMQYNISPETLASNYDKKETDWVEKLLHKRIDTTELTQKNVSLTANGWCYSNSRRGFLPELMEKYYEDRKNYKKKMLVAQQEYEKTKNKELKKEIARLDNMQMAMKIALNSAYGATSNEYFKYYDLRLASSITLSGQLSIRWMANKLNQFMNKTLKTVNKDYVIAIDTDSIYLTFETLVEQACGDKSTEQKIKFMDKICEEVFQPLIESGYKELAEYTNAFSQKMKMKREVLADRGIWIAKKRYVLNVHNSEGVQYAKPKLKIMGLEMIKSSTPSVIRSKLKESLEVILHKKESDLHSFIEKYRTEFMKLAVEDISFPRTANNLSEYYSSSSIYSKGTPIHVRGSLLYNHNLEKLDLKKKYPIIKDGEKIKFVYLRTPNPIQEDIISFVSELPKEFSLHQYVDYDKMFQKVFLDAIQNVVNSLGWNTEVVSNLEEFFG